MGRMRERMFNPFRRHIVRACKVLKEFPWAIKIIDQTSSLIMARMGGKCPVLLNAIWMNSSEPLPFVSNNEIKNYWNNINKCNEDKRRYRAIELANRMKILLISDPETEKSAVALDVKAGSLNDPPEVPGLAHFCEHMLFLGTEKYPDANGFSKYVTEHGGHNNATTLLDHTVYFFDITPEFLEGALDRFAQFFISPLFSEDCTSKEVNAIDSEFEKNYAKDLWRLDQLDKHTARPGHPYTKFSNGNILSLVTIPREKGIDVREELKKFHAKWYSSNLMTAAILGKEDLDCLEKTAVSLFSQIADKKAELVEWTEHPFGPEQFRVAGFVVPVKNIRTLSISFPAPDFHKFYRTKPYHYISSLLGHEGPGSLLSALKRRGWCDRLISGARVAAKGFGFFYVKMDLTEQGIESVHEIVKLCFQYVHMLNSVEPQKWFFDEYQNLLEAEYRFKEKEKPYAYVTALAKHLHLYPVESILEAGYVLDKWDPDLINELMELVVPSKIRIAVVGQKFDGETDQVEPWFGTKYKLEEIPDYVIQEWEDCGLCPELVFPNPNDFIPSSFDIMPKEQGRDYPIILQETPLTRLWYKQDDEFFLPRANMNFEFFTPLAYIDPFNCNLASLYVQLVQDSLNEYAYAAALAGLLWEIKNTEYGIMLKIGGYNDKQVILFDKILERMMNLEIDPQRFEILKEAYVRTLENFNVHQPYEQTTYYLSVLLSDYAWQMNELLEAAEEITVKRLEEFIPQMFSKLFIECLMHGNVTEERALEFVSILEKRLQTSHSVRPLLPLQLLRRREMKLLDGANFVFEAPNMYHKSSSTETYFQCTTQSTPNNMLIELLAQIAIEPAFDTLRTQEQLGYMVYSGIRRSHCVQGFRLILQSQKHPLYLDQRIEAFLIKLREILVKMDDTEYETHKEALANRLLEKPKTLAAVTKKYWREISIQQYHFNRPEEEVQYLRFIKKRELLEFFDTYIKYDAPHRRKLTIHVLSQAKDGAGTLPVPDEETLNSGINGSDKPPPFVQPEEITDITRFKSSHGCHPFAEPYASIDLFRKYKF